MIARLSGETVHVDKNFVVIMAGGVGYKVFANAELLEAVRGRRADVWIHTVVREDALELFGFLSRESLSFFELLLGVPGIGPRTALSILGLADIPTLRSAVASGDTSYLTKVSGIGRKTAEKIVLELEGKLGPLAADALPEASAELDAIEALKALGYAERESRQALQKVPKGVIGSGERVKAAMKILSE